MLIPPAECGELAMAVMAMMLQLALTARRRRCCYTASRRA